MAMIGIFLFSTASILALRTIQPPIQGVPGCLTLSVKRPGGKLTTHLHLDPKLRMLEAVPHSPSKSSWLGA
jgi:hypothetical protein